MLRLYDLLENVLIDIEKGLKEGINSDILAAQYAISERHLRKLFKFAFKQSLGEYIRSRKLAASLDDLLKTDSNILDIALDYGYDYDQSYLFAFKREFGITPGDLRKTGHIVRIKPPLCLFNENKLADGLFFGPDIVMVPQFQLIGKRYTIELSDFITKAQKAGLKFWENERSQIKNAVYQNVYFGYTKNSNVETASIDYMPSIQVKNLNDVPQGYNEDTFNTTLCARFRYIGEQYNYYEINRSVMYSMYYEVNKINSDERIKYTLLSDKICFEKVNISQNDGTYCQIEWFTPIEEKNENVL